MSTENASPAQDMAARTDADARAGTPSLERTSLLDRAGRVLLTAGISVVAFWVLAYAFGVRYNRTPSLPRGFYSSEKVETADVAPGQIVLVCPPEETALFALERGYIRRGPCASGVSPLGKVVVAMGGDTVVVGQWAVTVNGYEVPFSQPLFEDSIGRPIRPIMGTTVVPEGHVYVLSNYHGRSFDSRYIGPLRASDVTRTLKPLLTWGNDWEDDLRSIFG